MISEVQFEVRGLKITFTNPNDSSRPTKDSDDLVLKKFAETMIEQCINILVNSRKSKAEKDCLYNLKLLYDENQVLECKGLI